MTEADREVEALIRDRLLTARPHDGFLGEESGTAAGDSGITWVVDPIDGTVNYAYGIPAYNVSIAAVQGEPDPSRWEALAAAVHAPAVGRRSPPLEVTEPGSTADASRSRRRHRPARSSPPGSATTPRPTTATSRPCAG